MQKARHTDVTKLAAALLRSVRYECAKMIKMEINLNYNKEFVAAGTIYIHIILVCIYTQLDR